MNFIKLVLTEFIEVYPTSGSTFIAFQHFN